MKIGLLSDSHVSASNHFNEIMTMLPARGLVDVMVLLVDIAHYGQIFDICKHVKSILDCPVIFVAGNHEYYSYGKLRPSKLEIEALWFSQFSSDPDLHLLLDSDVEMGGISFFGSTWWSNMGSMYDREMFRFNQNFYSDFNFIVRKRNSDDSIVLLDSMDLPIMNREARLAYSEWFAKSKNFKRVFLAHFPMLESLRHPHFPRSVYFVSEDDEFIIDHKPDLICFGHTHWNMDKRVHGVRCVSNMNGYQNEMGQIGFNKNLVINI